LPTKADNKLTGEENSRKKTRERTQEGKEEEGENWKWGNLTLRKETTRVMRGGKHKVIGGKKATGYELCVVREGTNNKSGEQAVIP